MSIVAIRRHVALRVGDRRYQPYAGKPENRREVHRGYGSRENDLIEKRPVRNV